MILSSENKIDSYITLPFADFDRKSIEYFLKPSTRQLGHNEFKPELCRRKSSRLCDCGKF